MQLLVDNTFTYVNGKFPLWLIDDVTSYKVEGRFFAGSYKKGFWDGKKKFRVYNKTLKQHVFPTGFLKAVTNNLDLNDAYYEVYDNRDFDFAEPAYTLGGGVDLRVGKWDFQAEVLEQALLFGRGTVKMATGGGKSICGAAILKSYDLPSLWITHKRVLFHQMHKRLESMLERPVGRLGDGYCELEKITIAMVQTLSRRLGDQKVQEYLDLIRVVIGDEIHHLEADQWYKVFAKLKAPQRFGLTATPNTDGPGMALTGMTGPILVEIGAKELIERKVLVPPRIIFIPVQSDIKADAHFQTAYSQGIVNNGHRNAEILRSVKHLTKLKKPTLILVSRLNHGHALNRLLGANKVSTDFINGDMPQLEREMVINQLITGELSAVVAMSSIMSEGVDIPVLEAVINATGMRGGGSKANNKLGDSGRVTLQILGRGLRASPDKEELIYIDFQDNGHKYLEKASRERLAAIVEEGFGPYVQTGNSVV